MAKTRCVVCLDAKGRRICPLKGRDLICPVCCAGLRNSECEGCGHWSEAKAYNEQKTTAESARRQPQFTAEINPAIDAEVDRALAAAERDRLGEAERILSELLGRRPDLHMVQYGMGVVRALQERHADALVHFDRAVQIYPYFVEAWFNKGTAHKELLEVGPMVRAYQKVLELGDPAEKCHGLASEVVRDLKRRIRTEKGLSLERFLELMDVFDEAHAAMQGRQWERALAGFRRVVAGDPEHAQSYGNMGLCHAFTGRKQEAIAAFDRALEIDPDYGPARTNRAHVLALKEGVPLSADFISVDFYQDQFSKRR